MLVGASSVLEEGSYCMQEPRTGAADPPLGPSVLSRPAGHTRLGWQPQHGASQTESHLLTSPRL